MKKPLSLFLCLVMTLSITTSSLAAAPTEDLTPPLWQQFGYESYEALVEEGLWTEEEYADTVSEQKDYEAKIAAYKLAHADELAAFDADAFYTAQYSEFIGDKDSYLADNALTEEDFRAEMLEDYVAVCISEQMFAEERDRFITDRGGVLGALNVMLDGKYLTFPADRAPVAKGGAIYADAATLSAALGVTLSAPIDGYVAVRSAGELAGLRVYWDSDYQSVVLINTKALAAQIDKDYTIVNGVLAKWSHDPSKNYKADMKVKADVTVFDSFSGDKSGGITLDLSALIGNKGVQATGKYDISKLMDMLMSSYAGGGGVPTAEELALLKVLSKSDFDLRVDLKENSMYLKAPFIDALNMAENQETASTGSWYSFSLGTAASPAGATSSTYGSLLLAGMDTWQFMYNPVTLYDTALALTAPPLRDEHFVKDGSNWKLTLTNEDFQSLFPSIGLGYYDLPSLVDLTITVRPNGSVSGKFVCQDPDNFGAPTIRVSGDFTFSPTSQKMTLEIHTKNLFKLTMTLTGTTSTTTQAPLTTPPEGVTPVTFPAAPTVLP